MHKWLFASCFLLGTSSVAVAQTVTNASSPTSTASVVAPRTAADTVQAVHELFSRHRTGGWIWTSIGAAFAVRIITASASTNTSDAGGTAAGVAFFGGLPAAIGIGKLVRFGNASESEIVATYTQTKHLPKRIRRRLKRKYFN